jgi:hypothetical protein
VRRGDVCVCVCIGLFCFPVAWLSILISALFFCSSFAISGFARMVCLSDGILLYGLLSGRHFTLQPRGAHTEPHGVVRGSVGFQWLCVSI